jgi:hypothetical protein
MPSKRFQKENRGSIDLCNGSALVSLDCQNQWLWTKSNTHPTYGMHLVEEFYNLVKGMKYDCGTMSSDNPIL